MSIEPLSLRALFEGALALRPDARVAWLDAHCTEPALRVEVDALLRRHAALATDADLPHVDAVAANVLGAFAGLEAGARIGPFVLERELGRGGMGAVWLATRDIDGGTQRVALKLAASWLGDEAFRQRLRAERRVLASLEHPNIARFVDFGTLEDGRPYFAMEYVDGEPITAFADARALDLAARVALLDQVGAALEHAHRRLVVHRDLKPHNVLVARDGQVKLLDFGIAKLLESDDTGRGDEATRANERYFSLRHAAPEQVAGRETGVATDLYALGTLAYELLAGASPFAFEALERVAAERAILEETPALPSRRVVERASIDAAAALVAARARGFADASSHARALRGDLDAIVAKLLRKRPVERCASVEQLRADLHAWRARKPIALRRDERAYRMRRFVQRHAVAVGLGLLVTALAIGGGIVLALQAQRLARERDAARAERARAEEVTEFVVGLFRASDPELARGRDTTARELLERGVERIHADLDTQPALQAVLLDTLGEIQYSLADYARAYELADAELASARSIGDGAQEARALRNRARASISLGRYDAALTDVDAASALVERLRPEEPTPEALGMLRGAALRALGRPQEAVAVLRVVHEARLASLGSNDERTWASTKALSHALDAAGDTSAAIALISSAVKPTATGDEGTDAALADALHELARLQRSQGALDLARANAERALDIRIHVFGEAHALTLSTRSLLGGIAWAARDAESAARQYESVVVARRGKLDDAHPAVAAAEYNLGMALFALPGRELSAEPHLRFAVESSAQTLEASHPNRLTFEMEYASLLRVIGRVDESRDAFERLERVIAAKGDPRSSRLALVRAELACIDAVRAPTGAALARLREAAAATAPHYEADDPSIVRLEACGVRGEGR